MSETPEQIMGKEQFQRSVAVLKQATGRSTQECSRLLVESEELRDAVAELESGFLQELRELVEIGDPGSDSEPNDDITDDELNSIGTL